MEGFLADKLNIGNIAVLIHHMHRDISIIAFSIFFQLTYFQNPYLLLSAISVMTAHLSDLIKDYVATKSMCRV